MTWALNILFPGAGLILRHREWLGLCHAILFALCANLAIAAKLIAPDAIPSWLAVGAGLMAVVTWTAAQVLLSRQIAFAHRRAHALATLAHEARVSMDAGRFDVARAAIDSALVIDPDHNDINALLARLTAMEVPIHGDHGHAPPLSAILPDRG